MLSCPMDIPKQFPVRKTKAQRKQFQNAVQSYLEKLGYTVTMESGNLLVGNPTQAKYLLACGNAGSGISAWLEILRTFPANQRQKVCFLLFDGKYGISSYRRMHRQETDRQLLLHIDHVGDGHHMRMFPTKNLKQDIVRLTSLYPVCGYFGSRDLLVEENKRPLLLKGYSGFPYAVTICALQDHKKRMRYHSRTKDSAFDETNVNILRAALTTFLCCDEVN